MSYKYDGYQITCGCHCSKCGRKVQLEGYSDAWGSHYCSHCRDYVPTYGACKARGMEQVLAREERIKRTGADKE